ncbi:hypothetical protein DL767_007110 [Monosporascus sp. MG133]|nr:hypothetical protein DL767_007110 [Monosporascus sp. MG133]
MLDPYDTDRMEYIKAIAIKAGRYWTPIRIGFFRKTGQDSRIDEHFLPKGTMVVYNSYQINRDPAAYNSPDQFIPERWMDGYQGRTDTTNVVDKIGVPHMGHGAGRRLCMGIPNQGMKTVFPPYRACGQTSADMDPIKDQISPVEAQGVPRATGVRVTARNPEQLSAWIEKGRLDLQDWIAP